LGSPSFSLKSIALVVLGSHGSLPFHSLRHASSHCAGDSSSHPKAPRPCVSNVTSLRRKTLRQLYYRSTGRLLWCWGSARVQVPVLNCRRRKQPPLPCQTPYSKPGSTTYHPDHDVRIPTLSATKHPMYLGLYIEAEEP
jgi:hypothetical protein